jgi:excisionase family DNA binding protein
MSDRMIVQLTTAELQELMRGAVEAALAEQAPQPEGLLDLAGVCQLLACSAATVTRLCREGLPHVRLGVHGERRWRRDAVLQWLEARGKS